MSAFDLSLALPVTKSGTVILYKPSFEIRLDLRFKLAFQLDRVIPRPSSQFLQRRTRPLRQHASTGVVLGATPFDGSLDLATILPEPAFARGSHLCHDLALGFDAEIGRAHV